MWVNASCFALSKSLTIGWCYVVLNSHPHHFLCPLCLPQVPFFPSGLFISRHRGANSSQPVAPPAALCQAEIGFPSMCTGEKGRFSLFFCNPFVVGLSTLWNSSLNLPGSAKDSWSKDRIQTLCCPAQHDVTAQRWGNIFSTTKYFHMRKQSGAGVFCGSLRTPHPGREREFWVKLAPPLH